GLNPYAQHSLSVTRTLFRGNSALVGAGAMEMCGNSSLSLSASTLSANTSGSASGAVAYVQGSAVGLGTVNFSYVTAAEQVGHVLALSGLSGITLTGSLLAAFDTTGATEICFNPNSPAVGFQTMSSPTGSFNAFTDDGSCNSLMLNPGNNVLIPVGTTLQSVVVPIRGPADYYPASSTGAPFGLTDYYLPKVVAGSPVLDVGQNIGSCGGNDQRNLDRRSGTACDIGAVERLQVTARDDAGESVVDTDRLAIVDVLANDSYGEDDINGPYMFAANTAANPAVVLLDDAGGRCSWKLSDDPLYPGKLVVQNLDSNGLPNGAVTTDASPIICTYQVTDSKPETSTTTATVKVQIRNQAPNALNDSVLRPVGQSEVVFNPLDNDNDKGDGKFGLVLNADKTYGPAVDWATFYPIEIVQQPSLGKVFGSSSGLCPGSSTDPRICLNPPLRYVADNNLSPFSDTFTYHVFDADGQASGAATVTVYTDAPDPDHGGGAGSLDWLTGAALGLLGLRRVRRL
ncbi:MAG TPA: choice-of-anchor Q domain-containing protein, partial [Moraxellaceae bacterium]|nr:choice-of-anchor Q domain-containing protein [Moraxellaceae bacterium]